MNEIDLWSEAEDCDNEDIQQNMGRRNFNQHTKTKGEK